METFTNTRPVGRAQAHRLELDQSLPREEDDSPPAEKVPDRLNLLFWDGLQGGVVGDPLLYFQVKQN